MDIRSFIKFGIIILLAQVFFLETGSTRLSTSNEYCQSSRTHWSRGHQARYYYNMSQPGARALCDMRRGTFVYRPTSERLFHPAPTDVATPTTRPGRQGTDVAFRGPVRSNPLFTPGGRVTDFISAFEQNSPHQSRRRRDLHAWPEYRVNGQTQLACGAEHIRRGRSRAYMNPVSACMLAAASQEWRRTVCPQNTPDCQLRFGDMTYGDRKPGHWPHRSHARGWCVDVWPIRKPGNSGDANVGTNAYDRDRTRKLIEIFQKWGGATPSGRNGSNQIFFDDAVLIRAGLTRPLRRTHLDHIHICFSPTGASRTRCQQASRAGFDANLCPGIGGNTGPVMVENNGRGTPRSL